MKSATEKQGVLSRLVKDRRGNFGMMTALLLPVLLGAGGISIDMTKMMMTKNRLQDASDSAALAAASALANDKYTVEKAKLLGMSFLKTHMLSSGSLDEEAGEAEEDDKEPELDSFSASVVDITETPTKGAGKSWVISVTAKMDVQLNPLTKLLYGEKTTVSANTTAESATESKSAISMYLVLDKSGSMLAPTNETNTKVKKCDEYNNNQRILYSNKSPCKIKKIEALKLATASLFSYLNMADPQTLYVRTGTVSYEGTKGTDYDIQWGTSAALSQVNGLTAWGNTSSTGAMKAAVDRLKKTTETTEHDKRNGEKPQKFIVFMTDGENTNQSDDTKTLAQCKAAKDTGMIVYSVAFMAPPVGQALLKDCASSAKHYFEAEKMSELVTAFEKIGQEASALVARLTH